MGSSARKPRTDRDGVRVFEQSRSRRLTRAAVVVAVATVAGLTALAIWLRGPEARAPEAARGLEATGVVEMGEDETSWAAPVTVRRRERPAEPTNDAQSQHQPEVSAGDVIEALRAAGETEGIAAFNPPGTDPIKLGLVVPEDFELPDGYVRHYQVTDDGERLESILMFSPDFEFLDASGNPVALPESGIVPPAMAPPGLPIRTLEMPKNPYGGGERPGTLGRE